MISIVDYGMGNLGSISNMLKKIGVASRFVSNIEEISAAEKIILPGVGSFDNAMEKLNTLGFSNVIKEKASSGTPVLGICLGMQLLGTRSEEGIQEGLDLIPGVIRKFPSLNGLRIPHMGWNKVDVSDLGMFKGLEENKFYFVHSYFYDPKDSAHIGGKTEYGINFTSSVHKSNIYGVQFHPEKSHKYGMQLLKNFAAL
ncbi:MAG: imidazole glycerol phosphate synthase subunit HisH [Saprospiraceae bacterium]|nr:MAG: imidazole glycerol phosphate synthase subunit HisH [Saprospiraceae bacterium]